MYYKEFNVKLVDLVEYVDGWEKERDLFREFAETLGFYEVNTQQIGDVALFSVRGRVCHCGVIVSEDTVLHTTKRGTTTSNLYFMEHSLKFVGIYRYKDKI